MWRVSALLGAILTLLAGCEEVVVSGPGPSTQARPAPAAIPDRLTTSEAARAFVRVTRRMEPVAERECRARTRGANCDFRIVVDDRPNQPANAYQTLDETRRPVIAFTLALIGEARNEDELAFVLGHEASHHIAGHIDRQQQNAMAGAVIFSGLATLTGGDAAAVRTAQQLGATVGARTYSKEYELEADQLGTILTMAGGYDPIRGAQFFNRIPDPGDRFLGTHPPNALRMEIVRRTAARQ
jgi:predicted Zn-dependent protease